MTVKQAKNRGIIFIVFLFCLLSAHLSFSISSIQISIEQLLMDQLTDSDKLSQPSDNISTSDFLKTLKLQELKIEIDLAATPVKFKIDLSQIDLPQPYNKITELNITCPDLQSEINTITCRKGRITFKGLFNSGITSSTFSFTYNALSSDLNFSLDNIKIAKGSIAIKLQIKEQKWQSDISVSAVNFKYLKPYVQYYLFDNTTNNPELIDNTKAVLSFTANMSGLLGSQINNTRSWLQTVHLRGHLEAVQYLYDENMADNLAFKVQADLIQKSKKSSPGMPSENYQLAVNINKITGEILHNDIYIMPNGNETISAQLTYYTKDQSIDFSQFAITSKDVLEIKSKGNISLKQAFILNNLDAQINFIDLAQFNRMYLTNILSDTDYEGLELEGAFKGIVKKNRDKIKLSAQFKNISTAFDEQFSLIDLNGDVYWNNYKQTTVPVSQSQLSWHELTLNQLPLSRVKLNFITHHDFLKLNKEVDIPLFDGALHINSFEIAQMLEQLPDSYKLKTQNEKNNAFTLTIDGFLKPLSLELLSRHFNWPLLDGTLSAVIPSTTYNEKYLKVGGAMMLQVFDGTIIVKDLEILEPLKSYAQLSANIDLNNLNLQSLTKTYNFGEIQGRIEGKLSQLELSAWQPIAFNAYIRTPENDKSSHKISQRAIDNLSSLGGTSGLLSRSFLSFFETFRYNKIGISCKLKNNICRMSGVEEKGDGYYIVKGGGIPRIDVMGFQKQVNWQVLTSRLKAIQHANEAVIQ